MVDVQIEFDAGARRDPEGQTGLAVATSRMMGKGIKAFQGQSAMDENQLGEAWADLGAMVSANASADRMAFSLRSLTRPELLDAAVALAARELAAPSFPSDVWQSERERWLASNTPSPIPSQPHKRVKRLTKPYSVNIPMVRKSMKPVCVASTPLTWRSLCHAICCCAKPRSA
jgi:zinc protease